MDVKWNWLLLFCLLVLCLFGMTSSTDDYTIQCKRGCDIVGDEIQVEKGKGVVLHFTIRKGIIAIELFYNTTRMLAIVHSNVITDSKFDASRFKIPSELTVKGEFKTLDIKFDNVSLKDNDKRLRVVILEKKINESKVFYVLDSPKECAAVKLEATYTREENSVETIDMVLCGNPRPNVTAKIGSKVFDVETAGNGSFRYKYATSVRGISRDECGKRMELKAVGHKTITKSTTVTVLFTPDRITNVSAQLDHENCMKVGWVGMTTGRCTVKYEVQYVKNGTITNETTMTTTWHICDASVNDTVKVRAIVNEHFRDFDVEPIYPRPAPTTTKPPTTTVLTKLPTAAGSTKGSDDLHWKYILAIVVGIIALILIIAVVVIASRKKGTKPQGDNNNDQLEVLRPNPPEESDYAEVNTFATPAGTKEPLDENHMVYAELGPGGGRTGPKPPPEESNYAKVKTEGLFYPPLQQSHREPPPKKSYYEPPKYSVASRGKRDSLTRPLSTGDNNDDDYIEDILV